ncbi:MAG TPA: hypothetical protein VNM48_04315 [Chloroflexota bacterium]|nr:hypothetical protein [Chloroflexota bacterium]
MGFPFGITKISRDDHADAAIRANIRDDRIRDVLTDSDDIRLAAMAQAVRALAMSGASLDQLDVASDEARRALKTLAGAAAQSRAELMLSAREALIIIETAAVAARQLLADEAKAANDVHLGDQHANMMAQLKTIDDELRQEPSP